MFVYVVMGMVWCKALAPWSQNSGNGHEAPPSCTSCSMGVCVDRCCDICCQGCVGCFGCLCPRDCLYTFCAMIARLAHYCSVGQKPEPAYAMPGSRKFVYFPLSICNSQGPYLLFSVLPRRSFCAHSLLYTTATALSSGDLSLLCVMFHTEKCFSVGEEV